MRSRCRICRADGLITFLSLGEQPPANAVLRSVDQKEERYPLGLALCPVCELVQLTHVVPAERLFSDYVYFSSVSKVMEAHFAAYARDVAERFVPPSGFVVEIGSNDGILLKNLRTHRILGVEPAAACAQVARSRGVPTRIDYFGEKVARQILDEHGPADAILGNNVLAHIDDLHDAMRGFSVLAAEDGVLIFEVPYILDFFEGVQFDTVYHEHVSYFGVAALSRLMHEYGFEIFDVRRVAVHGGSIRVHAARSGRPVEVSVPQLLQAEQALNLRDMETLRSFAASVERIRDELVGFVDWLRRRGSKVVGYTAPAKGNVLLNYCGLELDYLADATPAKQGTYSPGMHIPIVSPDHFMQDNPQQALLLAWNHKAEVLERAEAWRRAGGRFIIPLPRLHVV